MKTEWKASEVKLTYKTKVKASERMQITDSQTLYLFLMNQVYDMDTIEHRETFKVILLNRKNAVLGIYTVSEGGLSETVIDVRLILQAALLANASGIIITHNHPSGNLLPSSEDNAVTSKIQNAYRIMNISLLDHIICVPYGYYSYADEGKL